jgi:hypothetical protein
MSEALKNPASWTLTLLERELRDAAEAPSGSAVKARVTRWLSELNPGEADLLWGRALGRSWAALAAEHGGVNEASIVHRLYMPAMEHLRTVATLDTFERTIATCTAAVVGLGKRLEYRFDELSSAADQDERAA